MKDNINWKSIKTILLDMDGTLLDLHFDNYFWQEYLPVHWGKMHNMDAASAKAQLKEWYLKEAGTLSWYCLDFWTDRLKFDVLQLKADVEHLIQYRPHAESFLEKIKNNNDYSVIMVTNAHVNLIKMKTGVTGIDSYFDEIISSHTVGHAKEEQAFWQKLHLEFPFEPEQTVLIDDNLTVLRAAKEFGIKNLLTILKPDSQNQKQDPEEFEAIDSFLDIKF
jgi:GMP/IMP 5'-nucleotidase